MCRTDLDPTANPHRLPKDVRPVRYDLTLSPDLGQRDFVGEVAITITVQENTGEIVCNAADLSITKAWIVSADGSRNDAAITLDPTLERATFVSERTIPAGESKLHVQFAGTLNDKLIGFYASTYQAEDGTTKVIATTQMESTDCRRAFPCWDEPDAKAVFNITLVVAADLAAFSNMHEVSSSAMPSGKRAVQFADTPIMSSYLVCMVVGELEATEPVVVNNVPIRVIARPGRQAQSAFALDVAAFSLQYFESWYGIAYPGTKMDLIATPDFVNGAMENLGAITFREALLLVDETKASKAELERIADVVSHEIAHMWFGDLVTMTWWNGLWLNEAFATFAEVSCVAKYKPEWERWTSFGIERSMAQQVDALHSTRPIEFPVISPADAEGMFDVLTYQKGGAVLRMLEQYLGEEQFRLGIKHYLETHAYGNAETTDLFDAIEEITGQPVRKMMDGWIFKGGFPLVKATKNANTVTFTQEQFSYLPAEGALTWDVPVLYNVLSANGSAASTGSVLLGAEPATVTLPDGATGLVINAGGHGFYRVHYEGELAAAVLAAFPTLESVERYDIVADSWAAVLAGAASVSSFISLVRVLSNERNPHVWTAALGGLRRLYLLAKNDPASRLKIEELVRSLVGPIVEQLGVTSAPNEDPLISSLRGLLTDALGTLGQDPGVAERASAHLTNILNDDGTVDADLGPALLTVAASRGDSARYEAIVAARAVAPTPQTELRFLQSLASFSDPTLLARALELSLSDAVRSQDAPYFLMRMLASPTGGEQAWAFIRDSWDKLNDRLPGSSIPRMLDAISGLAVEPIASEVRAFFTTGAGAEFAKGKKSMTQHLERLTVSERLVARLATELPAALG
jgi:puromycin-sensitive aminopeptidase